MVFVFNDKISETFSAWKYSRSISESRVGNIHFVIKGRGCFDKKQEEFWFEIINENANQI